jgi:asparagine synthase (glutamine-hydrolysing)
MCGIVGFVDKKGQLSDQQKRHILQRMIAEIQHRGRDDEGICVFGPVALGQVRLSILDLSTAAHQPFMSEIGDLALIYNGEIYNYREINHAQLSDHAFRTSCDTETLLVGYEKFGTSILNFLNGMFAFTIYDERAKKLVLAVDRFSIKPLYLLDTDDWFAWGSEMKVFCHLPGFSNEFDASDLSEFLRFRQTSGSATLVRNVRRVLPAELIEYDLTAHEPHNRIYWKLEKKEDRFMDDGSLWSMLERTIQEHLLADVPVGVQLSGGIDSSLVAYVASKQVPRLQTYAIGLADEQWNEFAYSRYVAKVCETDHTEILFTEQDFCELLPILTYQLDEPVSHSHSVPMYLLAQRAHERVKVLLSGEGADELFLGYRRYETLCQSAGSDEDLILSNAYNTEDDIRDVFPDCDGALPPFRAEIAAMTRELPFADRLTVYDVQTHLPPLLLRQDKMGMAANLENRVPFLDHHFAESVFSLPVQRKISERGTKLPLKRFAERIFTHEFTYRKKCGFGQPIGEWLKHPEGFGKYISFLIDPPVKRPFLDYAAIRRTIAEHLSGRREHTQLIWTLIVFEIWMQVVIDRESPTDIFSRLKSVNV